ncbi:MAG: hypothetical protein ABJQ34_00685 [Paracoccaceae bacterium]
MLRQILTLVLVLFGAIAQADPKDDADFFMSYFIDQREWDRSYRIIEWNSPILYRDALLEKNVIVLDRGRFRDLMPDTATEDTLQLLKSHVTDFVVESYGTDTLAKIAEFFRTPTGKKMLIVAKNEVIFEQRTILGRNKHPMREWGNHLSVLEFAQYNSFTNTPAGRVFFERTVAIRRAVGYEMTEVSKWPTPSINKSYIVEIIKADGVLKFSNRTARQSLIRELSASIP